MLGVWGGGWGGAVGKGRGRGLGWHTGGGQAWGLGQLEGGGVGGWRSCGAFAGPFQSNAGAVAAVGLVRPGMCGCTWAPSLDATIVGKGCSACPSGASSL